VSRVLYSGTRNASSWAFRAWLALREQGLAFEETVVDIRQPQRFENLEKMGRFSPARAVPVLVDEELVIFDSLAIMEYANDIGGTSLLPSDAGTRARCRSLVSWQHAGLSGICSRLSFESAFYPDKRPLLPEENADAAGLFSVWEAELEKSGGPWLFGALTLADLAFVPTVLRIVSHNPDMDNWPRTGKWAKAVLSRASVREWLDAAERLPPVVLPDYRN
jgi:glutathione S-transferase